MTMRSGATPASRAHSRAFGQEAPDVTDDVVVNGFRVSHAGLEPNVGRDHRGVGGRGDREVIGIAESADVVADHRAKFVGALRDRCPPSVRRNRGVESRDKRLDGGKHPVEFLLLAHLGPRPRLDAADVEDVGAVVDVLLGEAQERVEVPELALVVKRVRRAIENAHDKAPVGDVDGRVAETQDHARDRTSTSSGGPALMTRTSSGPATATAPTRAARAPASW